jgi:hypothetical protein
VKTVQLTGPLANEPFESIDQAVADTYPWAIRPDGRNTWCYLAGWLLPEEAPGGVGSHNYVCQTPYVLDFITEDPSLWFVNHESLVLRLPQKIPDDTVIVRDLTRGASGQPWTAQELVAPSTITKPIEIAEVEF